MDRLPQEIIDRIAAGLPDVKLAMAAPPPKPSPNAPNTKPSIINKLVAKVRRERGDSKQHTQGNVPPEPATTYWTRASAAAISRKWQRAVEPIIYSRLHLGYDGLEKLKLALQRRPELRAYLRSLTVVLALTTDHHHWTELGVGEDALAPLFSALGSSDAQRAAVDLTLRFEAGHPDLRHRARHGIVLDRTCTEPLGAIPCVRRLDFTQPVLEFERDRRNVLQLHLVEQARLIAHLPNLQSVAWHWTESESQPERDAAREAFAAHIAAHVPQRRQITQVSLTLSIGPLGARVCAPSGVGADSYENLYAKLQIATAHVTDLRYAGVVGPSFFRDLCGGGQWRALRKLTICMAMLTPTGQFYFDPDVGVRLGSDPDTPLDWRLASAPPPPPPQHAFWSRAEPSMATMAPLLRALAGLLRRLPALEEARLLLRHETLSGTRLPWAVCYLAPGQKGDDWVGGSELDIERPRVWFVTGRWRPADDLARQFRSAGRGAGHGDDASLIHWSTLEAPVRIAL